MDNVKCVISYGWITVAVVALLLMATVSGCQNVSYKKRDPNTELVIEEYERSGFPDFSDGDNKNLPFANISLINSK